MPLTDAIFSRSQQSCRKYKTEPHKFLGVHRVREDICTPSLLRNSSFRWPAEIKCWTLDNLTACKNWQCSVGFLLQRSAWVPGATTAHGHCVWLLLTLLAASSSQSCSPSATLSPVSGLCAALWQRVPTPSISPSLPRLGAVKDWYMSQCVLTLPHFILSFCSWLPVLLIYDDFRPRCRGNRLLLLLESTAM